MGVAPFNIASSVILITAQRLGRRLCVALQEARGHPARSAACARASRRKTSTAHGSRTARSAAINCKGTGYKGRVGVYQVMPITDDMRQVIMRNGNALDIAEQAQKEGVRDLRQSGLLKVKSGITSLEEIEAITNE